MATTNGAGKRPAETEPGMDPGELIMQMVNNIESKSKAGMIPIKAFLAVIIISLVGVGLLTGLFIKTVNENHNFYMNETEKVILTRENVELSNSWERLPVNQRKERLRGQWYEIVRYYNMNIPPEQKMNDEQILNVFNQIWICTDRLPHVNFFLPVAYMKVKTNFNPVYNINYEKGISGMYLKMAERVSNLPLVRNDPVFQVAYKGSSTVNNPTEAIKLLIARIDDLMSTFNNREDWVLLSLFTNEYDVIAKYWEEGKGEIPDELYEEGQLAEALKYYHSFKNWQIPAIASEN